MAQLVARLVRNEKVGGSNPPSSTTSGVCPASKLAGQTYSTSRVRSEMPSWPLLITRRRPSVEPPLQLPSTPHRLPQPAARHPGGRQSRWVRVSELVSRGGVLLGRGRGPRRDDEWCLINPFVLGARADVIFHHERLVAPASGPGSLGASPTPGTGGVCVMTCLRCCLWL